MQNSDPASQSNTLDISVVVPARDEEESIRALLDGLLGQTLTPNEIVIADGGSVDRTCDIVEEFISRGAPVKLIPDENSLPGRSRNLGVAHAKNDWIGFIDAGIRPDPNWLEALAEKVRNDPEVQVVYGTYEPIIDSFFKECAAIVYVSPPTMTDEGPVRPNSIASALMRRAAWESTGGFPEDLRSAEDLVFMRKVQQAGFRIVRAPRAIVRWNIQPGLWPMFRRFVIYSRNNIRAGLFFDWQGRLLIYYALIAYLAFNKFVTSRRWALLGAPAMWLLFLIARGVRAIRRNRKAYPGSLARNFARLCLIVPIIGILDAATFLGSLDWLLSDKLRLIGSGGAHAH